MITQYKTISKQKQEITEFVSNFHMVYTGATDQSITLDCPNKIVANTLAKAISAMGYVTHEMPQEAMFMVELAEPTITIDALIQAIGEFMDSQSKDNTNSLLRSSYEMAEDVMDDFVTFLGIKP